MTGLEGTRPEARAGLERLWPRILDRLIDLPQLSGESLSGFARAGLIRIQDARLRGTVLRTLTHAIRDGELAGDRLTALRAGLLEYVREGMADKTRATERGDSLQLAASLGDSGSIEELRRWIADPQVEPSGRSEAFETLVATRDPGALETAARILRDARTPPRLRELVLDALGRLDEPRVGELVLELYPGLGPGLGARAIVLLTEREAWGRALLDAIKQKRIPSADVHLDQVRKLKQTVKDPTSSQMIVEIWGILRDGRNEQRELIVGQMRNHLAKTPGDPVAGIKVFERVCAECHKLHGQGQDVGPDITSNGRNDFSQLLKNVFDPNLVIGAGHSARPRRRNRDDSARGDRRVQAKCDLAHARGPREADFASRDRRLIRVPVPGQAAVGPHGQAIARRSRAEARIMANQAVTCSYNKLYVLIAVLRCTL
jgi:hypothetical protein